MSLTSWSQRVAAVALALFAPGCIAEPDIIPGVVGAVCDSNAGCESGVCVEAWDGKRCEGPCDATIPCPRGWVCAAGRCEPRYADLCRICDVDEDCEGLDGGPSGLCAPRPVGSDGVAVSACLATCGDLLDCPVGSACEELSDRPGVKACVPTALTCPVCSNAAVVRGDLATCSRANEAGTCVDAVRCEAPGAAVCGARTAASELCNGVDDDCDGALDAADAGLERVACERSEAICEGAEKGPSLCVEGAWQACGEAEYGASWRSEEDGGRCDTVDNDCDGATDEGLTSAMPDGAVLATPGAPCGTGLCAGGAVACDIGTGALTCSTLFQAEREVCNGRDDDCDGVVDELPADEAPLNTLQAGVCAGTRRRCAPVSGGAEWVDDYSAAPSYAQQDAPDAAYIDADCDGVDGDASSSVFVDAARSPGAVGCGTRDLPCATLSEALAAARAGGKSALLLRAGRYAGPLILDGSVSVYGGYRDDWSRCRGFDPETGLIDPACASFVSGASLPGAAGVAPEVVVHVTGRGAGSLVLGNLVLSGNLALSGAGASSIGLLAHDADVRLEQVLIRRGRGSAGADGVAPPPSAQPGEPARGAAGAGQASLIGSPCGSSDAAVDGGRGGAGVPGTCGAASAGGAGGRGGGVRTTCTGPTCIQACLVLSGGSGVAGQGTGGGAGGAGGTSGTAARAGVDGADGAHGAPGIGGRRSRAVVLESGWPVGVAGGAGGLGTAGAGGAGGGGGGGYVTTINGSGYPGGGGGSGGAGGCAATAGGGGGQAGGGAYGIVALRSRIEVAGVRIEEGAGGAGGRGGAGVTTPTGHRFSASCGAGTRAAGGVAGAPSEMAAGRGGAGGLGGVGGASGSGAGGGGGPLVGVLLVGGELVRGALAVAGGAGAGVGGAAGARAAMPCGVSSGGEGEAGERGLEAEVWTCAAGGVCEPP
jgi:hypothetical protein